jgi:preprotein translocase subunit SecA
LLAKDLAASYTGRCFREEPRDATRGRRPAGTSLMINAILTKIVGSKNERTLKRMRANVERTNALEPATRALTDEQLRAKKDEFRARLDRGESLNDLLPEAFAVVREAGRRVL